MIKACLRTGTCTSDIDLDLFELQDVTARIAGRAVSLHNEKREDLEHALVGQLRGDIDGRSVPFICRMHLVCLLATERDSPRASGSLGRVALQTTLHDREDICLCCFERYGRITRCWNTVPHGETLGGRRKSKEKLLCGRSGGVGRLLSWTLMAVRDAWRRSQRERWCTGGRTSRRRRWG